MPFTHDTGWQIQYTLRENGGSPALNLTTYEDVGLRFMGAGGQLYDVLLSQAEGLAYTTDGTNGQVTWTCPAPSPMAHWGAGDLSVQGFVLQTSARNDPLFCAADTTSIDLTVRLGGIREAV